MPYRAPELFDVKTGITLDEKVDIWVRLLENKQDHLFYRILLHSHWDAPYSLLLIPIRHSRTPKPWSKVVQSLWQS